MTYRIPHVKITCYYFRPNQGALFRTFSLSLEEVGTTLNLNSSLNGSPYFWTSPGPCIINSMSQLLEPITISVRDVLVPIGSGKRPRQHFFFKIHNEGDIPVPVLLPMCRSVPETTNQSTPLSFLLEDEDEDIHVRMINASES